MKGRTTIMNRTLYLAYGSNLNQRQMSMRCPTAKVIGATTLKDYRLVFRGLPSAAVATVEPMKGRYVPVLLWEIGPSDEEALDRYEGYPVLYRKEKVRVYLGIEQVSAFVYILNGDKPLTAPRSYYSSLIWEGYEEAGFDEDILRIAVSESAEAVQDE